MSIRASLYLLLATALVPLLVALVYDDRNDHQLAQTALERQAQEAAQRVSSDIDRLVSGVDHLLRSLALSDAIRNAAPKSAPDT